MNQSMFESSYLLHSYLPVGQSLLPRSATHGPAKRRPVSKIERRELLDKIVEFSQQRKANPEDISLCESCLTDLHQRSGEVHASKLSDLAAHKKYYAANIESKTKHRRPSRPAQGDEELLSKLFDSLDLQETALLQETAKLAAHLAALDKEVTALRCSRTNVSEELVSLESSQLSVDQGLADALLRIDCANREWALLRDHPLCPMYDSITHDEEGRFAVLNSLHLTVLPLIELQVNYREMNRSLSALAVFILHLQHMLSLPALCLGTRTLRLLPLPDRCLLTICSPSISTAEVQEEVLYLEAGLTGLPAEQELEQQRSPNLPNGSSMCGSLTSIAVQEDPVVAQLCRGMAFLLTCLLLLACRSLEQEDKLTHLSHLLRGDAYRLPILRVVLAISQNRPVGFECAEHFTQVWGQARDEEYVFNCDQPLQPSPEEDSGLPMCLVSALQAALDGDLAMHGCALGSQLRSVECMQRLLLAALSLGEATVSGKR